MNIIKTARGIRLDDYPKSEVIRCWRQSERDVYDNMKCFAAVLIVYFGLMTDRSFANDQHRESPDSGDHLNMTLLLSSIIDALKNIPAPIIEKGDNLGAKFADDFTKAFTSYGQSLLIRLYEQSFEIRDKLIEAIERYTQELERAIKSIDKDDKSSPCLDSYLKAVIEHLQKFLDLIPGNALIKRPGLPEMPPQPTEVVSTTRCRTASEMFLHFDRIGNADFSSMYGFIAEIFLKAWEVGRPILNILQTQLRDEILNKSILNAYKRAVDRISRQSVVIKCHVKPETWKSFEAVRDRIVFIFDDYHRSKDNKNDQH